MKKLFCFVLCVLVAFVGVFPAYAVSPVPSAVMKSTESVVRILAEYADGYATGSGFVVKSDRDETLIATNYHVVEDVPISISVWIGEQETINATILAFTNQKDMCILKLAYPVSLQTLPFAKNGSKQGDAVYAVGFPGAADYLSDKEAHTSADATITDGIVSAIRETTVSDYGTPIKMLQINAAINSGNSGGPLFNVKGEVVGINTYGINDSQGIFGAIEVSELAAFMAEHNLPIPKPAESNNGIWAVSLVVVLTVVCVLAVAIIWMRKRKMMKQPKSSKASISLREYMAACPNGLGAQNAVAMLLPVSLQLRDLHNDGKSHLQVSPNSIFVGANGATLADATSNEAERYTSGFAAPEIYRGVSAGNLSDIYSFCAILDFVATGIQPANSLSRAEMQNEEIEREDALWAEIINTGTSIDAANRFTSMQEVIFKLSPYNVKPFVYIASEKDDAVIPVTAKSKMQIAPKKIAIFAAVILLVGVLGSYFGCYFGAMAKAKSGDFVAADSLLFIEPITRIHDAKLVSYINAGVMLEDRQYDKAKEAFEDLSGYIYADQLKLESTYRLALQKADANNFSEAKNIMSALADEKYCDSEQKMFELRYREGAYYLLEEKNFSQAERIFHNLVKEEYAPAKDMHSETCYLWAVSLIEKKEYVLAYEKLKLTEIKEYSKAKELLASLEEAIYAEGQSLYYDNKYTAAEKRFSCIKDYRESEKFLILIEACDMSIWTRLDENKIDSLYNELLNFFYFEDAAEVLLSSQELGERFLKGTWRGDGYYFKMNKEGEITYDLPWFDYGDYYKIMDSSILLFPKGDEKNTRSLFTFRAITPNSIEVFCYKNNRTYTLHRK